MKKQPDRLKNDKHQRLVPDTFAFTASAALLSVGAAAFALPAKAAVALSSSVTAISLAACILMLRRRRFASVPLHPRSDFPPLSDHVMRTILRSHKTPFILLDSEGKIVDVSEGAVHLLGYRKDDLLDNPLKNFADCTVQEVGNTEKAEEGVKYFQIRMMHREGYPLEWDIECIPIQDGERTIGTIMVGMDASERKRQIERIRYMAYYDDMTGLPNRRMFMDKLDEAMNESAAFGGLVGVYYVNIDRFKLVNTSFGREFGDMLLLQIAERLLCGRRGHHTVARMEGDEFALLVTDAGSEEELLRRAKELLKRLEEPFEVQGFPLHVTASIGIATNRDSNQNAGAIIRHAETALVKAKDSGRNCGLVYSDKWDNSARERLKLQHELFRAIRNREFVLHYQPQYRINSGRMVGVEALVRWEHPERGLVQPKEFIPLAEDSGMIVQLGDWVLEEACRQNKAWQDSGLPAIPVSVNLSLRQFMHQNLPGKVAAVLKGTGLPARYLDLEITESVAMDTADVSRHLSELARLGVGISVDDFGTGYSSFLYLRKFPIDRLKIDRSFVRDIMHDPGNAEIVAAIIAMAHNLNLQVIAEGVETEDQVRFLKRHRCDEMQGFFRSPPVPGDKIAEMLGKEASGPYTSG